MGIAISNFMELTVEANQSLLVYFLDAGFVVKMVMLLLLAASIASWTLIFQRGRFLKKTRQLAKLFEKRFYSGIELSQLYAEVSSKRRAQNSLATIFHAGFKEYNHLHNQSKIQINTLIESVQRSMGIAYMRETEKLESHLPFLASVGSTSPYVGLFGTVWGIMTAFQALGNVQQATIAMVAPGISEALIATAMGLFAAIPAVLAYNRYSSQVERLQNQFTAFQETFSNILLRKAHNELDN